MIAANSANARLNWPDIRQSAPVLHAAFEMQLRCIRDVHHRARRIVQTPAGTPDAYAVAVGDLPASQLDLGRNLFSTLFLGVYDVLDISPERRWLYGRINQLFRSWVTSADNLLDAEDKVVLPVALHGESRVMREVVAIMAADRILFELLRQAIDEGVVSGDEATQLSTRSLQVLLPSAGQEASEEGGVLCRPDAEDVLETIHRYKTGLLFHLPFLGPETLDNVDRDLMQVLKDGLLDFGLGCQLLDDTRDMARDCREKRQNYLLSRLAWQQPDAYTDLSARSLDLDERLYQEFPGVAIPTVRQAFSLMCRGLGALGQHGFGMHPRVAAGMASAMFTLLDLRDLAHECVY